MVGGTWPMHARGIVRERKRENGAFHPPSGRGYTIVTRLRTR